MISNTSNIDYKKLNLRISALHRIMWLEGRLVDKSLLHKEWSDIANWNSRKKATAKALRKFIHLRIKIKEDEFS